jgi:DNA-binding transcriptional LysR family regulator
MSGWDGIDEFVAVATAGTFVAGAKILEVSTTHMSRAIAALENRIHAQLFHRTTRTVRLTDAGLLFLDHCRRMIAEREEAVAMLGTGGEPRGDLRITCSTAMGERFVAPIVRRYAERFEGLNITIELTNRLVDLIAEGFDLAIRTGHLADSRLIATRIASRTLHTCASPAYLDRCGRPKRISDLNGHQCLAGTAANWHFRNGKREELHRPAGRWRCNSGAVAAESALAGMGICQLPDFYVLRHLSAGTLEEVLGEMRAEAQPIWAVYPQRRHLQPKITELVATLRNELPAALGNVRTA